MFYPFYQLIKGFLVPPGLFVVLLVIALSIYRSHRIVSMTCVIAITGLFYFMSIPLGAFLLAHPLQKGVKVADTASQPAQAIVILGGGSYLKAPEYEGKDTVSEPTLVRLRYGAYLYQKTHLPVLTSGGRVYNDEQPEGVLMAQVLKGEFGVPVTWVDDDSLNTWAQAKFISDILKSKGISSFYLVTTAIHMPRSMYSFSKFGLNPIPAPTQFVVLGPHWITHWIPGMGALSASSASLHEYFGLVSYWVLHSLRIRPGTKPKSKD